MTDGKNTVLIVDDDADFAESLVDLLSPKGYVTRVAHSIEEALEAIQHFDPKVALLDIRLGRMSGLTLIPDFKMKFPDILCVIMTAYAAIDTAIQALQEGAYDYLRKPLNANDLLATLNRCFDRIKLQEERLKAQESLRRSEEKYRNLVETMNDGLVMQDQDGFINYVNNRFCELLGYDRNEVIGLPIVDLLDSANKDIFISQSGSRRSTEATIYELTWNTKDNSKLPTIVSPRLILDKNQNFKGGFYVLTDISDRKKSEEFVQVQRDLGISLSKTIDLKEALRLLLDAAIRIAEMDNGSIMLVDKVTNAINLVHFEGVNIEFARKYSQFKPDSRFFRTYLEGKPIYRCYQELGFSVDEVLRREGLTCYAAIPIMHEDRVIAALNVGSHVKHEVPEKARPLLEALATHVGGVIARIEAESNLTKERATLDNIINLNPYGILVFDSSGKFLKANRAFLDIFHKTPPEYYSIFKDYFLERSGLMEEVNKVKIGQVVKIPAIEFNPRDFGSEFIDRRIWMTATIFPIFAPRGGIVNIVVMIEDISAQMHSQQALKESEEKFRAIVESASDFIFLKDIDLRYIFVNPHMEKTLGIPTDKILGMTDRDIFDLNAAERNRIIDERVLRGEIIELEHSMQYQGIERTFHVIKVPIRDYNGQVTGLCGISRDITERKRFEIQLLEYQKQLQSLASQLTITEERERRRLSVWLHDEISQTLAFAKIKLSLLKDSLAGDSNNQVGEIIQLIEDTIGETRSLTFELSPPVLYELGFEQAVEWLVEDFQKRHDIPIDLVKEKVSISINDSLKGILFQCLRELLANIVKHSSATEVSISLSGDSELIRVTVEDNGIGFNPDNVSERHYDDSRFGLFSIRERLKYCGGFLEIDSKPGNGTRILLFVPISSKSRLQENDQWKNLS
jgi:PAS domain S-box-containing protein